IAAALGSLAEGVLVDDVAAALELAATARDADLGAVDIAVADGPARTPRLDGIAGVTPAREVVTAPEGVTGALSYVVIVDDIADAHRAGRELAARELGGPVVVVTRTGE